ncbi:MAG: 5'-methylthioadenosine/S-adenosylhomocysteine nucleosidase [Synoicihabitans sp.]
MLRTISLCFCLFIPCLAFAQSEAVSFPTGQYGPRTFEGPTFTAVVAAYRPEIEALLEQIETNPKAEITDTLTIKGVNYYLGTYVDEPIIVFVTGVSITNAAMTMQMAFDYFPIKRVLYSGIAGGINESLEKGDVTVPARWYYHDESAYFNPDGEGGYHVADYFKTYSNFFPENRPTGLHIPDYTNFGMIFPDDVAIVMDGIDSPTSMPFFSATPELLTVADRAIERLGELKGLHQNGKAKLFTGGNGVTGSVFADNAEYRVWLRQVFRAEVTEMESAAVGQVCMINEVPWVIIRAVSDLAGGQEGKNEENLYDDLASDHAAMLLFAMLDELTE